MSCSVSGIFSIGVVYCKNPRQTLLFWKALSQPTSSSQFTLLIWKPVKISSILSFISSRSELMCLELWSGPKKVAQLPPFCHVTFLFPPSNKNKVEGINQYYEPNKTNPHQLQSGLEMRCKMGNVDKMWWNEQRRNNILNWSQYWAMWWECAILEKKSNHQVVHYWANISLKVYPVSAELTFFIPKYS